MYSTEYRFTLAKSSSNHHHLSVGLPSGNLVLGGFSYVYCRHDDTPSVETFLHNYFIADLSGYLDDFA